MGQVKFPLNFERLAIWIQPNKRKHLLHSFHITRLMCSTYNFLTTGSKPLHVLSIFACLYFTLATSLLRSTQVLQKPIKEISGNFMEPVKVGLAVLKKGFYFLKIPKGNMNMLSEESWFLVS